jgi:hypothetical protein
MICIEMYFLDLKDQLHGSLEKKFNWKERKSNTVFYRTECFHDFFFTKNKNLIQGMYTIGLGYRSSINVTIKTKVHSK